MTGRPGFSAHRASMRVPATLALSALVWASGCQDHDARRDRAPADTEVLARTPAAVPGDPGAVQLQALSLAELEDLALPGELACAFIDGGQTLLLARGDAASSEPARGVVRVGDRRRAVTAPGGFDGLLQGARFQGDALVVEVVPTGPAVGRGESPPVPADLLVHGAGSARHTVPGQWQCGP